MVQALKERNISCFSKEAGRWEMHTWLRLVLRDSVRGLRLGHGSLNVRGDLGGKVSPREEKD